MKRLIVALAFSVLMLAGCATSPTGRHQVMLVSSSEMAKLGLDTFQNMRKQGKFADAPRKKAYAGCVAHALIRVLPEQWRDLDWDVEIIDDENPNAFALPGGRIGVNLGMFKIATNQDQLAVVLGHELSHVVARHGAERVSDNILVQGGAAVATAYGASQGVNPQLLSAALGVGSQVGILLPFSRAQESEADVLGQRYMAAAGFDPRAAPVLWEKMMDSGGSRPPEFLSTHPSPKGRAQKLQKQAQQLMSVYTEARASGFDPNCHL